MKQAIITGIIAIAMTGSALAEETKRAKVLELVGKYEAAEVLGTTCQIRISVYGKDGITHESCDKFIKIQKEISEFIKQENVLDFDIEEKFLNQMLRSQDSVRISNSKIISLMQ